LIAFGLSIVESEPYRRFAGPGLARVMEPGSERYAFASVGLTSRTYNLILDAAALRDDLEALVLIDPHVELRDPELCGKVRQALADPGVAVAGCVGATGVRSLAWWRGEVRSGALVQHYYEHGEGEFDGFSWTRPTRGGGEVDAVAGVLMVLSPWAVRNLRFDDSLVHGYGFDVDYCLQARAAGRKVVVADLGLTVHAELDLLEKPELWVEAHIQLARKWEGRWPGAEPDAREWKERARRAEAEREAARAVAFSSELLVDARVQRLEKEMEEATGSLPWRLTEPLRRLNKLRTDAAERRRTSSSG
jgi:glycosyl transferase family 2